MKEHSIKIMKREYQQTCYRSLSNDEKGTYERKK